MKVSEAIAEILRREGITSIVGYPLNQLIETAAAADIRPIITRAERTAGHMADAVSRVTSGEQIGVYVMQSGPGLTNGMGAIQQAFAESVPMLVVPGGSPRGEANVTGNFNPTVSLQSFTKSVEPITSAAQVSAVMRRAFTRLRNGRGGPVVVEVPGDVWGEEVPGELDYTPVAVGKYGPDAGSVSRAVDLLLAAKRPVIYAGQGVHYAKAWPQLKKLAEMLGTPVCTSLEGKSAFPENHPLALGSGGVTMSRPVVHFLRECDLILGMGCSFTRTPFGVTMPAGKPIIHATLDPNHLNNSTNAEVALIGDAGLTMDALIAELMRRGHEAPDVSATVTEIAKVRAEWMAEWLPILTSDEAPLTPYRVIWDLMHTVDVGNTIVTHDAGSPRDQLSPFWVCTEPLSYIGWGKTTQLGYGLGLVMGAKLAKPEKLCINMWGDAAIGFTGMELETCVREKIPVLSILFNNSFMAMETPHMGASHAKYGTMNIGGDYTQFARSMGAWAEKVTDPAEIVPAIKRAVAQTEAGMPALLEFITGKELRTSHAGGAYGAG